MRKKVCLLGAEGLLHLALWCSKVAHFFNDLGCWCVEGANDIAEGVRHL